MSNLITFRQHLKTTLLTRTKLQFLVATIDGCASQKSFLAYFQALNISERNVLSLSTLDISIEMLRKL